jgi:hypothetical protein
MRVVGVEHREVADHTVGLADRAAGRVDHVGPGNDDHGPAGTQDLRARDVRHD